MTLDQLKQRPEWAALTPQQQKFLTTYLACNRDKIKTGHAMWKVASDRIGRDMVNKRLRMQRVSECLAVHDGTDAADSGHPMSRRELGDLLARRIRTDKKSSSATFVKMAELFIHLRGWSPAATTNPPDPKPAKANAREDVDALVLEMERNRR